MILEWLDVLMFYYCYYNKNVVVVVFGDLLLWLATIREYLKPSC